MATYRKCDVVGCESAYTEESMAYCNACGRDFCEYHGDLLLVEHTDDDYICRDCKTELWAAGAKERARVDYLRNIPPEKAWTTAEYKRRYTLVASMLLIAKQKYELLNDAKAALEQVHGVASGHGWQMGKLVSEARKEYEDIIAVRREVVDAMVLQWANGPYEDRAKEIGRWHREEGKHLG